MKRKFLTLEQFQENMKPKEQLTFSEKSPFSVINCPVPKTLFWARHGSLPPVLVVNGAQGTTYVCRFDNNDQKPLNFDVYSFYLTENKKALEIIGPQKLEYHWSRDIPMFLKKYAPEWVKNKVQKFLSPIGGTN